MPVTSWSTTAALNVLDSGTSGSGGALSLDGTVMKPSEVDNAFRSIMAQVASFNTAAAFSGTTFTHSYTDDGAQGPQLVSTHVSTTPAAADIVYRHVVNGKNSSAATFAYGLTQWSIADATAGSEDSQLTLWNVVAGALTTQITLSAAGCQIPAIGATTPGTGAFTTLSATGALTISEAGAGQIVFPASQNASAGANTLDDYEEGTWTPTITAGSGTFTTTSASGSYTKVGNRVSAEISIIITTNGSAATSVIATLPFTSGSTSIGVGREHGLTGAILQGITVATTTTVAIYTAANAYPGGSGATIFFSIDYKV